MGYQRKRYQALNDAEKFMPFLQGKIRAAASDAATNIVGGAANAAANSASNAFKGVKLPDVNVAVSKETTSTIYKAVGGLAAAGILIALIVKK